MDKIAVFVVNEKGGTGKSFFSRAWLDLARSRGRKVAAFDADAKVATLLKTFGSRTAGRRDADQDPLVGVAYFNIMDADEQEILLNAIDAGGDVILMDTPAGSMDEFERLLGSGADLFKEYREAGYQPVLALVLDTDDASTRSVVKAVKRYGSAVSYVVVKNLFRDKTGKFAKFEATAAELVRRAGGSIIEMSELRDQTRRRVEESECSCVSELVEDRSLSRSDRTSLRRWFADLEAQLAGTPLAVPPLVVPPLVAAAAGGGEAV